MTVEAARERLVDSARGFVTTRGTALRGLPSAMRPHSPSAILALAGCERVLWSHA